MAAVEAQCVVAIGPNYWGKGATIKEAESQLKKQGFREPKAQAGKTKRIYYIIGCAPSEVQVTSFLDCQLSWPKDATAMRLEEKW